MTAEPCGPKKMCLGGLCPSSSAQCPGKAHTWVVHLSPPTGWWESLTLSWGTDSWMDVLWCPVVGGRVRSLLISYGLALSTNYESQVRLGIKKNVCKTLECRHARAFIVLNNDNKRKEDLWEWSGDCNSPSTLFHCSFCLGGLISDISFSDTKLIFSIILFWRIECELNSTILCSFKCAKRG